MRLYHPRALELHATVDAVHQWLFPRNFERALELALDGVSRPRGGRPWSAPLARTATALRKLPSDDALPAWLYRTASLGQVWSVLHGLNVLQVYLLEHGPGDARFERLAAKLGETPDARAVCLVGLELARRIV